jgi:hydroxyacylglutathione hydrolase
MKITTLPVLTDNYIHVYHDEGATIVVDPAEAAPVLAFLRAEGLRLTHILLTHHHDDHIGGVQSLKQEFADAEVFGFKNDQHRLPPLTHQVVDGDVITIGQANFEIWHLPGHTKGHIAYISQNPKIAFSGDVLFGMGCGRLFEGTPQEMYNGLQRFKSLSPDTLIYCTHEYTVFNGHFSKKELPNNQNIRVRLDAEMAKRAEGKFTVPLLLGQEFLTNPFLLAQNVEEFRAMRERRNNFSL